MARLTEAELKKQIKNKDFSPVYILYGSEQMFVKRYSQMLIEAVAGKNPNEFSLHSFNGDIDIQEFSASMQMIPFMSEYNCVVVTDLYFDNMDKASLDQFSEIALSDSDNTVLIISMPTYTPSKNATTFKSLIKKIEVPFWAVFLLGVPLPLLSGLLSVGGKSFAEFTYLFLLGYYVFADEKIVEKVENNCLLLFSIGLAATISNVYLFLWSGVELALANTVAKYVSEWIMVIALIGLSKRYFDFRNSVTVYMGRRSFSFYCWHFIWVVLFQYILYGIVGSRTAILFAGTVFLSYLVTFVCCEISVKLVEGGLYEKR